MGFEAEYRDSTGRKHKDMASMLKAEVDLTVDEHMAAIRRAAEAVRCPEHGKTPTVEMTRTAEGASYEINGCCDDLCHRAEAAAAAAVK